MQERAASAWSLCRRHAGLRARVISIRAIVAVERDSLLTTHCCSLVCPRAHGMSKRAVTKRQADRGQTHKAQTARQTANRRQSFSPQERGGGGGEANLIAPPPSSLYAPKKVKRLVQQKVTHRRLQ
jgi:hypothetical protein